VTQDKKIQCKDCGKDFVWTADEQAFYQEKGFNEPLRCKDCRVKARAKFNSGGGHGGGGMEHKSFPITCSNCGKQDTVPFEPKGDRPVLCRDCFRKQREQ
jgi:CxxC-x17-CxxC domain-containing protein